ncbi:hypothetical protein MY8738_002856 [Beauveria namnaoensis]
MLSAKQDLRVQGEIGQNKANMAPHRVFLSGMSPGCLLLFACGVVLITNTALCPLFVIAVVFHNGAGSPPSRTSEGRS